MALSELIWDLPLLGVACFYVFLAPFTKVEESFNVQAIHDILLFGSDIGRYDHLQFPGVVPRTFLGPLLVSAIAAPVASVLQSPLARLYATRLALAFLSVAAQARLRASVARNWGAMEGRCLAILAMCQFHLPFYVSRPLPNIFATAFACLAHAELLGSGSGYRALALLAVAAATFRCDLLVLIAPYGLLLLAQKRVSFFRAAAVTASAAACGAALTVVVDSFFWQRWLWPELEVLLFNTAENKSSDWGVSPPLWYFYSALPRSLAGALPLALLGAQLERRARGAVAVALAFVALYSLLPHKELRFIFPALPLLNVAAAAAVGRCLRWKGYTGFLARLALAALAAASLAVAVAMSAASASNYPGGHALLSLHSAEAQRGAAARPLRVHIGNLAATTGVSRFLELDPTWEYSKEENLTIDDLASRGFDRLLTEWPEVPGYRCQALIKGFERISLRRGLLPIPVPVPALVLADKVYVLEKDPEGSTHPCDAKSPIWN